MILSESVAADAGLPVLPNRTVDEYGLENRVEMVDDAVIRLSSMCPQMGDLLRACAQVSRLG